MDVFWKSSALVLLVTILCLVLTKQSKDFALVLSMSCCILVGIGVLHFLEPVIELFMDLELVGNLPGEMTGILLKAMGIGIVSEIAASICHDAGNGSLGKVLQLLGSAAIVSLSIPIFQSLLELVQEILENI